MSGAALDAGSNGSGAAAGGEFPWLLLVLIGLGVVILSKGGER